MPAIHDLQPAEQGDDAFLRVIQFIDTLAEMHGWYDPEPAEAEAPCEPVETPTPSDTYRTIAAVLQEGERMPTGAELYALRINDPIMAYVWARVEDWTLYQI